MSVESGVVKYYKNGVVFYTSLMTPTYPLYFDAAIADPGARVLNAYFCLLNGSPVTTPTATPTSTPTVAPTNTGTLTPTATATATTTGSTSNTLIYLHTDHLGSISVATDQSGGVVSRQEFDPWGKVRTGANPGPVVQTKLNFTGQRLDDTGLLYYNSRYYDPGLSRFVSPDSIVPGAASGAGGAGGTVGAEQNSKLTVDFHETGFLSSVKGENQLTLQKGFWFQLSSQDANNVDPSGPNNPQSLNRYSYVLNNSIRYIDPSGHIKISSISGGFRIGLNMAEVGYLIDLALFGLEKGGINLGTRLVEKGLVILLAKLGLHLAEAFVKHLAELFMALVDHIGIDELLKLVAGGKHLEIWYKFVIVGTRIFIAEGEEAPDNSRDVVEWIPAGLRPPTGPLPDDPKHCNGPAGCNGASPGHNDMGCLDCPPEDFGWPDCGAGYPGCQARSHP